MKKTRFNKMIAAVLATMTMASTFTAIPASAEGLPPTNEIAKQIQEITEEFKNSDSLQEFLRLSDKDIERFKKLGADTLIAGIAEFVPGGKTMGPALQAILGTTYENDPGMALEEIDQHISELYTKLDDLQKRIAEDTKSIITIEEFDYSILSKFNSQMEAIQQQINCANSTDNIPPKIKLAMVASQLDNDARWSKDDNALVPFIALTNKIKKAGFTDNSDMFSLIYEYYAGSCMFNKEALDKAQPIVDELMEYYMTSYTLIQECLGAQLIVSMMEDTSGIPSYYLDNISSNTYAIIYWSNYLREMVLGKVVVDSEGNETIDKTGTVSALYDRYNAIDPDVIIDKGRCYKKYDWGSASLTGLSHSEMNANLQTFKNRLSTCSANLSVDQLKHIGEYAKSKGKTIRQLLEEFGISTAGVPQNAHFVTSEPYNDESISDYFSAVYGSIHDHCFYKGINIDSYDPQEEDVLYWNYGCNGWGGSKWDFAEPGFVLRRCILFLTDTCRK